MKHGSLFDGSGGFPLAGVINGMEPVWASEIEAYPLKVTAARFPNMTQLGDVTKINGAAIEPVDVITFGSPCQDLSVAGKQAGIHDGVRSNLFFEAIRIVKEMRAKDEAVGRTDKHVRPRFAVWENVPGAFSSNKGADFQAVLQALCEVADASVSVPLPEKGKWQKAGCIVGDGYSIAWRVYDAQFWGVPQRRKRIYLIADFGSERAGEILFEREGVRGDSAQGREAREGAPPDAEGSFNRNGIAGGFVGRQGAGAGSVAFEIEKSLTLRGSITADVLYRCQRDDSYISDGTFQTLRARAPRDRCDAVVSSTITGALCANSHPGSYTGQDAFNDMLPCIKTDKPPRKYIVRRLTPLECCRLQGFPDWWEDGVEGSDSARYKMWGNGIALPCAVDVLGKIAKAIQDT